MKLILLINIFLFLLACRNDKTEVSVPVISLNPDQAGEMKITDYFDHYEVLALKGILCESVHDVVEYSDRWIAVASRGIAENFLYAFDTTGNPLYPVGHMGRGPGEYHMAGEEICLDSDSILIVNDVPIKYLKYNKDGDILEEKLWKDRLELKYGIPIYDLDRSTFLYYCKFFYRLDGRAGKKNTDFAKKLKDRYLLNIVSERPGVKTLSYWEGEELYKYIMNDNMYIFRDTCCFFIGKAGEVFNVYPGGIVPRYRIDKGNYHGFLTKEEFMTQVKVKKIVVHALNETEKQVLGTYYFNGRYYIFIYDKATRQTRNYKTVDDDLLKVGTNKNKIFPSSYFFDWLSKRHFNQKSLIFLYSPTEFADMIEYIRGKMNRKEWKQYSEEHPDLVRVFNELDDNTNTVILKYHYK